jgi:dTDP-glucose 4,6-dehydratase
MNILVTGAAGFIGSHFCHYWRTKYPQDTLIALDTLGYAGVLTNLADIQSEITFVQLDIGNQAEVTKLLQMHNIQVIVNFAAESHNSYAILNPAAFFKTNCLGTQSLCAAALAAGVERVHHVSTCEVYGDLALESDELFTEQSPYRPRTPYNASKAAGDHVVRSYYETFGLPISITNCANNYGSNQFPEKLIPLFCVKAVQNEPLPLYKTSQNKREWIHALDHCRAIDLIIQNQQTVGQTYHVGTGVEASVEQITDTILEVLGKPQSLKTYVPDRPGHDRRYALDWSKIKQELGWEPQITFEEGLPETIHWYANNQAWWQPLIGKSPVNEGSDWN